MAAPALRRRVRLEVNCLEQRVLCDAQPIFDTRPFPFRAVAKVNSWWDLNRNRREDDGEVFQSSAAMIGPRSALTSAHVVYDRDFGGFATRVTIMPGAIGGRAPFGRYHARNYIIPDIYRRLPSAGNDIAVLNFATNVGRRTGWFAFRAYTATALTRADINNVGYPGDTQSGEQQFLSSGRPIKITQSEVRYRTSELMVEHGSSGSPVYRYFPSTGQRVIVGIHSRRIGQGSVGLATRITPRLSRFILNAQRERARGGLVDISNGRLTSRPLRAVPIPQVAWNAAFGQMVSVPFSS